MSDRYIEDMRVFYNRREKKKKKRSVKTNHEDAERIESLRIEKKIRIKRP